MMPLLKITAFKNDFDKDRIGVSLEVMNFLRDRVYTLVKGIDKRYAGTFMKHGVRSFPFKKNPRVG